MLLGGLPPNTSVSVGETLPSQCLLLYDAPMAINEDGYDTDPPIIKKMSGMNLEELIEMLRSAETLGLGVRVTNYTSPDGNVRGSYTESWELTLLADVPLEKADDEDTTHTRS